MSKETQPSTDSDSQSTGIYADIQNLQDIARDVLQSLIRRWPESMPPPSRLNLYVRADHAHLWRVWATHAFPGIEVTAKGVQHYSLAATKNAADMAIAVDAISDFNHKRGQSCRGCQRRQRLYLPVRQAGRRVGRHGSGRYGPVDAVHVGSYRPDGHQVRAPAGVLPAAVPPRC